MLAQRLGLVLVGSLALASVACAPRAAGEAHQPLGHVEVRRMESPDDAPEQAKTVQVSYVFDRDVVNKDFDKTFKDGFDKKGIRVEQQSVKGKCSLQPTAVLLLEHSVGAKLMVEPWVELDASRPSSSTPWKLDAQAGVSVHAATDIELFGRQMRKPKEFTLFEIALTKKGDAMGTSPRLLAPSRPAKDRPTTPSELAPGGPAEDLRVADARPTLNPFAAPGPELEPPAGGEVPRTASNATATAEPASIPAPVAPSAPDARPATIDTTEARTAKTDTPEAPPSTTEPSAAPAAPEPTRKGARGSKKTRGASATDPLLAAALAASPAKKVVRKPSLANLAKAVRKK